jgi:uncharacterized protein (TIGR02186 family)
MERRHRLLKSVVYFPMLFILALFFFVNQASALLTAKANHDHITVDFFYHGSTVSVRGVSDPDMDLIIKITSDDGHQTLREKGKVGGLLWTNVGELKIDKVPNLYFLHSTRNIEDILSQDEINKYVIGYPALEKHVAMNAADEREKAQWFNEFIKFKESSKLYGTTAGRISLTRGEGNQRYYILTQWPYQAPPGNYTVTVYAVKDRNVVETATSSVAVEQVGMVKSIANMAKNDAAEYGFITVFAALSAGFGVGMIFRKGGGAH